MSTLIETPARLLKARELEAHLDVTGRCLSLWIDRGMPVTKLPGGARRFDLRRCLDWLAEQHQHKRPAPTRNTGEAA